MKRLINILAFILLILHGVPAYAAENSTVSDNTIVIVIDPGHGGENEGTIENGFLEKEMTLITANAMYEELSLYDDVTVYMTRTEDVSLSLKDRADFAASVNADFLFSIHYNASVDHDLFGSEVWISSIAPYNAYGYAFGSIQMQTMQNMGLFLRGVKTKRNDDQKDYYGIIREATEREIPSAIIEHCHVDEERDSIFCDDNNELVAFGKADALSVAKYFGLKSSILSVDYSKEAYGNASLSDVESVVASTLWDKTPPEVCTVSAPDQPDEEGNVLIQITAADYDSPLIYYDYTVDGGKTFTPLMEWPGVDVMKGTYTDTFETMISLPFDEKLDFYIRAYNQFDAFTESNHISFLMLSSVTEEETTEELTVNDVEEKDADSAKPEKKKHFFHIPKGAEETKHSDLVDFLLISMVLVLIILVSLVISKLIMMGKKRRRRSRDRRNQSRRLR